MKERRSSKGSLYKGHARDAFIARWPGVAGPGLADRTTAYHYLGPAVGGRKFSITHNPPYPAPAEKAIRWPSG